MNMNKSGKSTFFHHIFDNNFLYVNFLQLLNSLEISIKFCAFWHIVWFFYIFLGILLALTVNPLFANFEAKSAQIGSK